MSLVHPFYSKYYTIIIINVEVLKERLRRKQKMNRSANVVAASVALRSNASKESTDATAMVEVSV